MHFRRHGGWSGFENKALPKNPGTSVDGFLLGNLRALVENKESG